MNYMHKIIVVTCDEDLQLQRLMEQRQLSERESKLMIAAQMSLEKKESMAQFVIENSGALRDTTEQAILRYSVMAQPRSNFKHFTLWPVYWQVLQIHEKLRTSRLHWKIRPLVGIAFGGLASLVYLAAKVYTGALVYSKTGTGTVKNSH